MVQLQPCSMVHGQLNSVAADRAVLNEAPGEVFNTKYSRLGRRELGYCPPAPHAVRLLIGTPQLFATG